jgi:excisionase family DNA binding protein
MMPNESLLDVLGAATRLGCNERFIRRLVQERRIPFFKVGGSKIRFSTLELDNWLERQRVGE